jgi:putative ABC transport system permease protein
MDSVVAGFLFGPITAILACLVAVWGTVSMPPYDAIRGTPRTFLKNRIWRRSPKVGKAPRGYITHYTFRNMSRHKVRTALTVVAIGGAIMLGSYSLFVLSSFYNSVSDGMEEYEKWDVLVEFAYPINGTLAAQVDSSDITEKAYVARIVGEWQMGTKQGSAVIIGMEAGQTLHRFKIHEGKAAQEPSEAMLNAQAAGEEGIRIGDTIELQGISGTVQLDVTALVDDYIGTLFVDMNVIEDIVGERIYSGMYLKTTPGKAEDVMTELQASPLVAEAMTLRDTVSGILGYFESYGAALYILTLLGVAVAAPTLVNIVFVGVLERYPEYGQLRAIGYPRKAVSKTILTELVVIVTAGAIIGIPLTYLMVLGFEGPMKSYIPVYSTLLYPADWLQFLAVLGLIYVIAFLAAAPSIRHVNRMDLAETIGERGFG